MAALQCELCGGKLVGKPGGMFECDSCGMEYNTEWAKAKIQEIRGTVQVEGTVEVKGTVKVEGSVSKESLLKRGQLALEDRDWKSAREYFEKALDIDPECVDAYFGIAMCAFRVNTLEDLVNTVDWKDKNYTKGKRFASAALLAQVEQLEQAHLQRKQEEAEKARIAREEERIAREKQEEEARIAREKKKQKLKNIRDRFRKASCLIDACGSLTVAVTISGGAQAVGFNMQGQCNVDDWWNLVQVSTGGGHTVGLKADGTVVATKYKGDSVGKCNVSGWQDIAQVSAGGGHTVGLKADGTVVATEYRGDGKFYHGQCDVSAWRDIVQVSAGMTHTVGLKADGTVVSTEHRGEKKYNHGQCDVSGWRDIVQVHAGACRTVGLKADGTVVAVGDNTQGRCNVHDWRLFQQLDTLEQEREETRGAARTAAERRNAGLCQHCGGTLKGLLSKKCASCGKPKDY